MVNVLIISILVTIAAGIVWYLIREKKKGTACVGCPYAKQCGSKCRGGCSCTSNMKSMDAD